MPGRVHKKRSRANGCTGEPRRLFAQAARSLRVACPRIYRCVANRYSPAMSIHTARRFIARQFNATNLMPNLRKKRAGAGRAKGGSRGKRLSRCSAAAVRAGRRAPASCAFSNMRAHTDRAGPGNANTRCTAFMARLLDAQNATSN